jgi:FkbM family methyltransferase
MTSSDCYSVRYLPTILDGATYFVPDFAKSRPAAKRVLMGKFYEPQTHQFVQHFFKQTGGSMIHAGTFFGDMLPGFSSYVPGRVYAFEPLLESYILANLCVQTNDLQNVFLFNAALGEQVDVLRIDASDGAGHAGGSSKVGQTGNLCPVLAIDTLDIPDIALIQLDVEGFELNALKGARQTITRLRPAIAIEDNSRNCGPYLTELGYMEALTIPGLTIWCPQEAASLRAIIDSCAAVCRDAD